jgi:hypothetical protein
MAVLPAYREHLRTIVASSAAPYGYTLTLWTTGAVTTHSEGGLPSTVDALLLLAGAVTGFGLVGRCAYGRLNGVFTPSPPDGVRVWGGMHLPSVGVSILLVSLLVHLIHGHWAWPLAGFTSTTTYLLTIGVQFWLATQRGPSASEASAGDIADQRR